MSPEEEREDTTGRYRLELRDKVHELNGELQEWIAPIVEAIEAHGKIVVIIEDDYKTRKIYRDALSGHVRLYIGEGVDDARHLAATIDHLDVLVLDMKLPDGTGIDVSAVLRRRFGDRFHTIVMSGFEVSDEEERVLRRHGGTLEIRQKPSSGIIERILDVAQAGPARLHMTPPGGIRKP